MGKINVRVLRKDSSLYEDHHHKLSDGSYTGGMLLKPSSSQSHPHTHLYEKEGKTLESGLAENRGEHTHMTELGMSSWAIPAHMDLEKENIDGGPGSGPQQGCGGGYRSPSARLRAAYAQPSKEFNKNKIAEYQERMKSEKDPEMIEGFKKAIEAHKKRI